MALVVAEYALGYHQVLLIVLLLPKKKNSLMQFIPVD